jgi:DnaJ-domain-containing protein 1
MGIWDRLGDVIKSYINDDGERVFGKSRRQSFGDPDVEAAFEELDDFLGGGEKSGTFGSGRPGGGFNGAFNEAAAGGSGRTTGPRCDSPGRQGPPEALRRDFAELGLPFGASPEECKAAYKKLLKLHHPDRHAGHPGNMQKATEKSARLNAAFDRIERWRQTGRAD